MVITIIILIILAAVTINLTMGDNGLFSIAKKAAKNYMNAQEKELAGLNIYSNIIKDTLEKQDDQLILNGKWSNKNKVNMPKLVNTGLTAVKLNESETITASEVTNETKSNSNKDVTPISAEEQQAESWYSYDVLGENEHESKDKNHWANAVSADGSMWVWIPRFAYKITYEDDSDKSKGGTIDVVFLKGTTDEPAGKSSEGKEIKQEDIVRASEYNATEDSDKYIVHPAFTDGSKTGYKNGEWDKEIPGFWMAKFEAGYVGEAGNPNSATDSPIKYSIIWGNDGTKDTDCVKNFYGERLIGTPIKYPTFQANRPSMNNISISDTYDLCMSIKNGKEIYNLSNIDSHLTKNSEWGAVAYLAYSAYGRNGEEITINNVKVNEIDTIYAVTGYGASKIGAEINNNVEYETLIAGTEEGNWKSEQGQLASTTGNIYGIYDLSGGISERTASYIATNGYYEMYGGNLKGESNKYKSEYAYSGTGENDGLNYSEKTNISRVGEAIWETSTKAWGNTGWNNNYSGFMFNTAPFVTRGGSCSGSTGAGTFQFTRTPRICWCWKWFSSSSCGGLAYVDNRKLVEYITSFFLLYK